MRSVQRDPVRVSEQVDDLEIGQRGLVNGQGEIDLCGTHQLHTVDGGRLMHPDGHIGVARLERFHRPRHDCRTGGRERGQPQLAPTQRSQISQSRFRRLELVEDGVRPLDQQLARRGENGTRARRSTSVTRTSRSSGVICCETADGV